MSEEMNREILLELKKINQKLEELNEQPKTLSATTKFIALFIGFMVIGPFATILISSLFG